MAQELEIKLKVSDLGPTRDMLAKAGAQPKGKHLETNTFFDTPDDSLRAAGKGLRVRMSRDMETGESGESDKRHCVVTFKGPRQPGKFKSREEIETAVGDPDIAGELFEALGFRRGVSFEKWRESWELDGCKVELDEVPHLGCFVEIEGPDEAAIAGVQSKLELISAPEEKQSYIRMLTRWMELHGGNAQHIGFA